VLLHDVEEADDDLGARADQDLALAGLLGVVDGVERIVQDGGLHLGGRFSSGGMCGVRYLFGERLISLQEPPLSAKSALLVTMAAAQRGFFSSTILRRSSITTLHLA